MMPIFSASSTWVKPFCLRRRAMRWPSESLPSLMGRNLRVDFRGIAARIVRAALSRQPSFGR